MPDRVRCLVLGLVVLAVTAGCTSTTSAPETPPSPIASSVPPTEVTPPPVATPSPSSTSAASPTPSSPTPSSTAATSTTYANGLELSGEQLSYTELRWFWRDKAQAECKKKGISSPSSWCNDYYFEKTGQQGRAVLAPDAGIKILDEDGKLQKGTTVQVQQAIEDDYWPNFRVWLAGDRVVRLEQVFTP
ncbi:MAG TPA: hypothetical protein VIT20_01220 [Propionibacteriaceae bacterium]